jgi:hypothetical protein
VIAGHVSTAIHLDRALFSEPYPQSFSCFSDGRCCGQ